MLLGLGVDPRTTTQKTDALNGLWQSDGYGLLFEIDGDQLKAFQTTTISCLPAWTAKRQVLVVGDAEAAFLIGKGDGPRILVTAGPSADWKFFQIPESAASFVRFRRLAHRPEVCSKTVENTPLMNFDIFWSTFAEQYPFFELRKVDWQAAKDRYRPQITPTTTRGELFRTMRTMLVPLRDRHVSLQAPGMNSFTGNRPDPHPLADKDFQKLAQLDETRYIAGKLRTWCLGKVAYGQLPNAIGYLRILGFGVYTQDRNFLHGRAALDEALDTIFQESKNWRGLIIDVRVNRGGSDVYGLAVASRLATNEYLGFSKRARNAPANPKGMTPAQESRVQVTARPRFAGRVVLLTSRYTISAGETFTMALLDRTPRITRVGENTQGIFSDVLWRDLPNGFSFGLPNEIYFSKDGVTFEGAGVPPDITIPPFPKDAGDTDKDAALEKAIEILSRDHN
jgi:hypothetical protein